MHAIIYPRYGGPDVLQMKEVERPRPKDNQILLRVQASSVNALDWHLLRGSPFLVRVSGNGLRRPKDPRIGADVAGRVEEVGSAVTRFQPGDEVFGFAAGSVGAYAEYVCAREDRLVARPPALTSAAAAAVPVAATTALLAVRNHGKLQPGQHVLINGASGGVGTFAVQLAKALGAHVTAVCGPRNIEQARALGADEVVDYTKGDITRSGRRYDLVLAVNGYHPLLAYRRILSPTGAYIMVGGANNRLLRSMAQVMVFGPALSRAGGQRLRNMLAQPTQQDLEYLAGLLAAGTIKPVIDRCYPLDQTAEAFRYFEDEHARGKVVITVD